MTRSHGIDERQLERKSRRYGSVGLRFFGAVAASRYQPRPVQRSALLPAMPSVPRR